MQSHCSHPLGLVRLFTEQRSLLRQMLIREVQQRYRGSVFGVLWSFLTPLLMLAVYTFVFSVVFEARWAGRVDGAHAASASTSDFALILFCGLMLHAFLAECLTRAPSVVLSQVNLVKKVVFPLEMLPIVTAGSALFHLCMSVLVLLVAILVLRGEFYATALYLPVILFPFFLFALGCLYILASLGVYVRDISQVMGLVVTVLLFMSPIFYPADALPEALRPVLLLNPLTLIIEQVRSVLLWNQPPEWLALACYAGIATFWLVFGFWWFQKTRKGFADVL